jgi:uncharacterized protein
MIIKAGLKMTFVLFATTTRSFTTGFGLAVVGKKATTRSTSKLHAVNFFDKLQENFFSTMSNPGSSSNSKYYTIGITGASGLVGTALRDELRTRTTINGKPIRIVRLQRSTTVEEMPELSNDDTITDLSIRWNPAGDVTSKGVIHPTVLSQIDTIIHLAGENVATGIGPLGFLGIRPWTTEKKDLILNSRVGPTTALANAINSISTNKKITFLTASGVGVYGDNFIGSDSTIVDESMDVSQTIGFLPTISRAWESAANIASKQCRVVTMRFGVVLSTKGGALSKLYPIFMLGGGGIVGSGQQYFSFISSRDIARAIIHIMETSKLSGPVNVCSPNPCTNSEFTTAFGQVINRPTILPLPSFAVEALFGQMGNEMLLGGVRTVPTKLQQSGFQFLHPSIKDAITSAITEKNI